MFLALVGVGKLAGQCRIQCLSPHYAADSMCHSPDVVLQHVDEDDEISEMSSGLGASTVDSRQHEQDLAGFPDVEHSRDRALSVVAEGLEGDSPGVQPSLVHPPVKFAASESSGDAQGIGTSVHPSRQDLQVVRIPLLLAWCLGSYVLIKHSSS